MVNTLVPIAIFAGAAASAALVFYTFWGWLRRGALENLNKVSTSLDASGVRMKSEDMLITWITVAAALWIAALLVFRPPVIVGLLLLPGAAAAGAAAYYAVV